MSSSSSSGWLEKLFGVARSGSSLRREALGGLTTFVTMSYILVVNPLVFLKAAGMPEEGAILATILACAVATLLMGLVANLPIALAPGMGLNAFFAFNVCAPGLYTWQEGLAVLAMVAGVFLLLTVSKARSALMRAVPASLRFAAAVGIGLFITFIGLQHAGLVVDHPATLVTLGSLREPHVLLAVFGLLVTIGLMGRGVRTAVFWGLAATGVAGFATGMLQFNGPWIRWPSGSLPGLEMDFPGALDPDRAFDLLSLGIALLFFSLFDAIGTLYAVGAEIGILDSKGDMPRMGRALAVDATGALVGAGLGTSSVTCYIESATGVSVGARTGLASVVTAACFVAALFCMPLVAAVGAGVQVESQVFYPVTAPALIVVGVLMARSVRQIPWDDITEAIPAFLTLAVMPYTFNISHGLAAGFVSYAGVKLAAGRGREVHWIVYLVAGLFALRYLLIGGE